MDSIVIIKEYTVDDVVSSIISLYLKSNICLDELLNSVFLTNLSVNQVFEVYKQLFEKIEKDKVIRIREEELTNS